MSAVDEDLPEDPELRRALRTWEVEGSPVSLDRRVLGTYRSEHGRSSRWLRMFLARVPLPIPVAVAAGVLLLVTGYVAGRSASAPGSAQSVPKTPSPDTELALVTNTTLNGFQPVAEVEIRSLGKKGTDGL